MDRETYVAMAAGLILAVILIAAMLVAMAMMADKADRLRFDGSSARIDAGVALRARSPAP